MTFTLNLTDVEIELDAGDAIHLGSKFRDRPTRVTVKNLALEVEEGALPADYVSRARFEQLAEESERLFDAALDHSLNRDAAIVQRDNWVKIAEERAVELQRWRKEALRHANNYESQFYARQNAEQIAEERGEALAEWINLNARNAGIIAQLRTQLDLMHKEHEATTDEFERVLDDVCTANPDEPVGVDLVSLNGAVIVRRAA